MANSISVKLIMIVIKTIVYVYDIITYPFYFLLQKPWKVNIKRSQTFGQQIDPNDPYSLWVCIKNWNHCIGMNVTRFQSSFPK